MSEWCSHFNTQYRGWNINQLKNINRNGSVPKKASNIGSFYPIVCVPRILVRLINTLILDNADRFVYNTSIRVCTSHIGFRATCYWFVCLITRGFPDSKVHGACRPQMGPMLSPWTLLSGYLCETQPGQHCVCRCPPAGALLTTKLFFRSELTLISCNPLFKSNWPLALSPEISQTHRGLLD